MGEAGGQRGRIGVGAGWVEAGLGTESRWRCGLCKKGASFFAPFLPLLPPSTSTSPAEGREGEGRGERAIPKADLMCTG